MKYVWYKDWKLSAIGAGRYALSGAFGNKDAKQFADMLHRAHELRVNFFDTADAYGGAEKILGFALRAHRQNVIISTKVGQRARRRSRNWLP